MNNDSVLGVIVPCLNEEKNLNNFYLRIIKIIKELNIKYKIYFIDDGSADGTWKVIKDLNVIDKNICGIRLSRNFGQQVALKSGIDDANCDYLMFMDADLQDPPELLKDMYFKLIHENLDVVYAERRRNNESFFKKYCSILFYKFFNYICKIKIPNNVSDFKIVNKKIINELKKINEKEPFYRGMIPWLGFKSGKVEFSRPNRIYGKSGNNLRVLINLTFDAVFNYSNFPRRLAFFLSLISFLFFISTIIYFFKLISSQKEIPDLILLFSLIFFFNSLLFFILGLISEYTGKIFFKINNNTSYIIDEKI